MRRVRQKRLKPEVDDSGAGSRETPNFNLIPDRFERANSFHAAAKEMVALAEVGLEQHGNGKFDSSWQETLNHATLKVKNVRS